MEIFGLVGAKEYNGYCSVILTPTDKERQENEEKGRVLVARCALLNAEEVLKPHVLDTGLKLA